MSSKNENAIKKAKLISNGKIYIPDNIKLPYPLDRSTAGPGSNTLSIALSFNKKNIKLEVSKDNNEFFSLEKKDNTYQIFHKNNLFLKNVKIIPTPFHCPNQVFINLENRCIYNCAFCCLSKEKFLQKYNEKKFTDLIIKAINNYNFNSVALTSGIYPNNKKIIDMMSYIILNVKKNFPNIHIGIEPCIFHHKEIKFLKQAGADEIKINLQTPNKKIFQKICPGFNYDKILEMLFCAVDIFGKQKVTSNLIFGLGETDKDIIKTIELLSSNNIIPTLRKIRLNKENKNKLEKKLSYKIHTTNPERILYLAKKQKEIFERYKLTTKNSKTMCHQCGCCDLVSFWDI